MTTASALLTSHFVGTKATKQINSHAYHQDEEIDIDVFLPSAELDFDDLNDNIKVEFNERICEHLSSIKNGDNQIEDETLIKNLLFVCDLRPETRNDSREIEEERKRNSLQTKTCSLNSALQKLPTDLGDGMTFGCPSLPFLLFQLTVNADGKSGSYRGRDCSAAQNIFCPDQFAQITTGTWTLNGDSISLASSDAFGQMYSFKLTQFAVELDLVVGFLSTLTAPTALPPAPCCLVALGLAGKGDARLVNPGPG